MLPHLDGAYRLALWIVRDAGRAQDVVQESYLRAFKAWPAYRPGNARSWLFTIVRRQGYDCLRRDRSRAFVDINDEAAMAHEDTDKLSDQSTPEHIIIQGQSIEALRTALMTLPPAFREVIMLKDIEDMSYKTIAGILGVPMGTVTSRLARARDLLRVRLMETPA